MRKVTGPVRLIAAVALVAIVTAGFAIRAGRLEAQAGAEMTIACPTGFATVDAVLAAGPAFIPLTSLKGSPNPIFPVDPLTGVKTLRADLTEYIANVPAAIQLGKALYWDMQAGSDNATACGTCHFTAGADSRSVSQLAPGYNQQFVDSLQSSAFGPNYALQPSTSHSPTRRRQDRQRHRLAGRAQEHVRERHGGRRREGHRGPRSVLSGERLQRAAGRGSRPPDQCRLQPPQFLGRARAADFNGVNPFGARD
jgi:hypothetical protein